MMRSELNEFRKAGAESDDCQYCYDCIYGQPSDFHMHTPLMQKLKHSFQMSTPLRRAPFRKNRVSVSYHVLKVGMPANQFLQWILTGKNVFLKHEPLSRKRGCIRIRWYFCIMFWRGGCWRLSFYMENSWGHPFVNRFITWNERSMLAHQFLYVKWMEVNSSPLIQCLRFKFFRV